jgi:hypothetical protein
MITKFNYIIILKHNNKVAPEIPGHDVKEDDRERLRGVVGNPSHDTTLFLAVA